MDKATDFNDGATVDLGGAEAPKETIAEAIKRLSALHPIEFDRVSKKEAKKLACKVSTLETQVKKARGEANGQDQGGQGQPLEIEDPEPWHEPVDGTRLAVEIESFLNRYLVLPDHATTAITLWIIFTYVYEDFRVCPMLMVESPQKRCGKSTLLALLLRACNRALPAGNISPSAVFRVIEKCAPTLIIDEADTFVRDNEELRGLLNCGHTREFAYILRNVEVSGTYEPHKFSTWGPKAVATIGGLKDTLMDRSIVIRMRRKKRNEARERLNGLEEQTLNERCARWAQDNQATLQLIRINAPEELHDRAVDNWTPLFTIASRIGGEWPDRARAAAIALTELDSDADSIAVQLLADVREILCTYPSEFIPSKDLASYLIALEDRPWADYNRGRPITSTKIARMLRGFGVKAGQNTTNTRGYDVSKLKDPFERYLTHSQSAEVRERSNDATLRDPQSADDDESSAFSNFSKPAPHNGFRTSALSNHSGPGIRGNAKNESTPLADRPTTAPTARGAVGAVHPLHDPSGVVKQGEGKIVSALPFPLPPLAEQRRIVAKIDELMALCDRLEAARAEREAERDRLATASLARLNAPEPDPAAFFDHARFALNNLAALTTRPDQIKQLRQTILNLAMRGKLVPQDPNDEPASHTLARFAASKARNSKGRDWTQGLSNSKDQVFPAPEGWVWTRIADTAERVTVGYVGPMKDQYVRTGIPFLRSQNVRANQFREEGLIYISPQFHQTIIKSALAPGDVVVVRSGNVGTACVIPPTIPKANCSDLVVVQNPECVISTYLCFYLNSLAASHVEAGSVGVALTHFNTKSVATMPLPVPPLAEQRRIVAKVDELLALCGQLEASLATGDDTRQRLLDALLAEALAPGEHIVPAEPERSTAHG